ncbi:hypothetical protein B0T18DRAFT_421181 [Schizothecium vesticola]|uniref:Uncharacterized protein n=1 Tax=Schizothecium vesticola TaxID=314040 RepID=A0AA40EFK9_9PEZI|nr:hypothetical protein B0T18DRAFT_421181 [Schizothecium vesticola]
MPSRCRLMAPDWPGARSPERGAEPPHTLAGPRQVPLPPTPPNTSDIPGIRLLGTITDRVYW